MLKSPESVRVKGVGGLRKKNNALIRANWWKLRQLPRGRGGGGGVWPRHRGNFQRRQCSGSIVGATSSDYTRRLLLSSSSFAVLCKLARFLYRIGWCRNYYDHDDDHRSFRFLLRLLFMWHTVLHNAEIHYMHYISETNLK